MVLTLHRIYFFSSSFLFSLVTRSKTPLGQILIGTLHHATFDVYSPKAVETLLYGKCYGYCFFIVYKVYFFCFIEALDTKGILNSRKKGITPAMECADVAAFTFAT